MYPRMFDRLHEIAAILKQDIIGETDQLFKTHLEWIHSSLDELFRKEKFLLFPFILKYSNDNGKDIKHKPSFDWVSQSHKDIIHKLMTFKLKVVRFNMADSDQKLHVHQLIHLVNDFESQYMELQLTVEEELLLSFESSLI